MNKYLIYDCKTESVKKVSSKDLNLLAPEMFLYVIETKDTCCNDNIRYKYYIRKLNEEKPSKCLDWFVTALEDKYSLLSFTKREHEFLNENGIPYNQRSRIVFVERYWYLTKDEIAKRSEVKNEWYWKRII